MWILSPSLLQCDPSEGGHQSEDRQQPQRDSEKHPEDVSGGEAAVRGAEWITAGEVRLFLGNGEAVSRQRQGGEFREIRPWGTDVFGREPGQNPSADGEDDKSVANPESARLPGGFRTWIFWNKEWTKKMLKNPRATGHIGSGFNRFWAFQWR